MKSTRGRWASFRMPFWVAVVAGQVIALVLVSLLVVTVETRNGNFGTRQMWKMWAVLSVLVALLMPPAMLLYVLFSEVWVSPGRFRGSGIFGRFVTVNWDSIHAARPFNLCGIPYLRVYSTETPQVIWLPLLLVDYDRFAELVAEYAGDDHPVTLELLSRLEADA